MRDRLDLGWVVFSRRGRLPALLAYLDGRGCDDFRCALVDFDAVRGD